MSVVAVMRCGMSRDECVVVGGSDDDGDSGVRCCG